MGLRRGMLMAAVLLVLTLGVAGCGGGAGQGRPQASGGRGAAADALVSLGEACQGEFGGVRAPEGFTVRLVTDIGRVDDGTFNQFANDGMRAAAECFGIEDISFIETASQADYARNLQTALSDDPDVVITVGFLLASDTLAVARRTSGVAFVGVDQFHPAYPDNYAGVLFREDHAGFIAGAAAGLLTSSGVVGVIAGLESVPPVVRYVNGFTRGARHVNPDISEPLRVFINSFNDPGRGASAAAQFLGEGADVVFGAAGATGSGGIRAAAAGGAWVIGVDQDEYLTTFSNGAAPGSERLATSAVKRVDLGVFRQIGAAVAGRFAGGPATYDTANGGVTYAPFHDAAVPEAFSLRLEEVRQGLADGRIQTGVDPATGQLR
ncbi:MAG: BMP family lipoprotein [Egibacteraceae bacterium]